MSKLLFALPNNGSGLDEYKTHTLAHPKGKPYTFLERDNKIFEINHLKEKYHSSFITSGEKTTISNPELVSVTQYDVMFLLVPFLETHSEKGKVSLTDLEMPTVLLNIINSMDKTEKKKYLEKFCDVAERGDEFYLKFNRDTFYQTLKKRHEKVLDAMTKHSLRSEHAEGAKNHYAATIIGDCLSNQNAKEFYKMLGLEDESEVDSQPPTKKKKNNDASAESTDPTEDYSGKENTIKAIVSPKMTKKEKDLKAASKGTKSISSFFKPKAKN